MNMLFEIAIESQREDHNLITLADLSTTPDMITRLDVERHASTIYTNNKFKEMQKEIEMSVMFCVIANSCIDADDATYIVHEDVVGEFKVLYKGIQDFLECQCAQFIRNSMICHHIFSIFKVRRYKSILDKYISRRWTKKACKIFDEVGQNSFALGSKERKDPDKGLFALACKNIAIVDGDDKLSMELLNLLSQFVETYAPADESVPMAKRKQKVIERYYGSKVPSSVTILDPKQSTTNGNFSRLESRLEAAVQKMKKPERTCRKCKTKGHHDSRNCLNVE